MGKFLYNPGDYLGPNKNILFLERLEKRNGKNWYGRFLCPYHSSERVEFEASLAAVCSGHTTSCGCQSSRKTIGSRSQKDLTNQIFGRLVALEPTSMRKDNKVVWKCQCSCEAKTIVYVKSADLLSGNTKSCGCLKSKGEEQISYCLQKLGVIFYTQKTFDDCRNGDSGILYKFDFYLPDYNTCIEYDGEQHFFGWNSNQQDLLKIQQRDKEKTQYCAKNNIKLIRIPYYDYNKINEEYLAQLLI